MLTPDEISKLIPDEVVESTAEAICDVEFWPGMWATLDEDSDECVTYRKAAIAAIAAGIAAWPGAVQNYNWDGSRSRIILPLKKEGV